MNGRRLGVLLLLWCLPLGIPISIGVELLMRWRKRS